MAEESLGDMNKPILLQQTGIKSIHVYIEFFQKKNFFRARKPFDLAPSSF